MVLFCLLLLSSYFHNMKRIIFILLYLVTIDAYAQTKILFSNRKGENAGNADWVVDADAYNIGVNSGGIYIGGMESNAQRFPSPAQSGITSATAETYWTGALSAWAVDLAKLGYGIESLPYNGVFSYGNASNLQDLSNYKVLIVCEPNIVFSSAEKTAIVQFVQNGGGLYMIAGHDGADRNGDGWDARMIWNDLMDNNAIQTNPFGIKFDSADISGTYYNMISVAQDSIIIGPAGQVVALQYNGGTTMSLNSTANNTVVADAKRNNQSTNIGNVVHAHCRFGKGKVAAIGDSSPSDDGTGDPNDILYDGYINGASGNHKKLLLNATIWLAKNDSTIAPNAIAIENKIEAIVYPNPSCEKLLIESNNLFTTISIINTWGAIVYQDNTNKKIIPLQQFNSGTYCLIMQTEYGIQKVNFVKQ
jgi:hypothetical protein